MRKILLIIILLVLHAAGFDSPEKPVTYNYDFDVRGGVFSAVDTKTKVVGVEGEYHSSICIRKKVLIPIDIEFDGYTSATKRVNSPTTYITYPVNVIPALGLGYQGIFKLSGRGFLHMMVDNDIISLPWSSSYSDAYLYGTVRHNYRFGGDVHFTLPLERFNLDIFSLNNIVGYDYNNSKIDSLASSNQLDHDWWVTSDISFNFNKKIALKCQYMRKSELDNDGVYDFDMVYAGVETDLRIFKKKFYMFGDIYGRYYRSDIMEERGYLKKDDLASNMGIYSNMRAFLRLKRKLYIKGSVLLDASTIMTKLRYELSLKKLWKKGQHAMETGYWSTPGTLFPRMCSFLKCDFGLGEYLSVLPEGKVYWRWLDDSYAYYRTNLDLKLALRLPFKMGKIYNQTSILCGVNYTMYEDVLFFPTTLNIYVGMRSYL